MKLEEIHIMESFKCYQGGIGNMGVKSPWWVKNIEQTEQEAVQEVRNTWRPTMEQITFADIFLYDVFQRLDEDDRKTIICRYGKGFIKSYRKCGKEMNLHHEVFRKQNQTVIKKLQNILDEIA